MEFMEPSLFGKIMLLRLMLPSDTAAGFGILPPHKNSTLSIALYFFFQILFYLLYLLFRFHFNQPDAVRKEEHFFPGPHGCCVLGLFCQKVIYRPIRTLNADFYRIGG